jgi:hypothetical protein
MTIRLQCERERLAISKQQLGFESRVAPQIIGQAESLRRIPYPAELDRLCLALRIRGYTGTAAELLEVVQP